MPFRAQIDDQSGVQYGEWKEEGRLDVSCSEGRYELNHEGKVWNKKTGLLLKPNSKQQVILCDGKGGIKIRFVYHLILETYFPHIPRNGRTADHIDENRHNNHISNLQWLTRKQQTIKSNQLQPRGKKSAATRSKPVEQWKDNTKLATFPSVNEAGRQTGIDRRSIASCARQEKGRPTAGGFEWKYQELESQKDLDGELWDTNLRLVNGLLERSKGKNKITRKSAEKIQISNLGRLKDAMGRISYGKKDARGGCYRSYKGWQMHQLVWMVWGDERPVPRKGEKLEILHNDNVKKDNEGCVDNGIKNLILGTRSENMLGYHRAKTKKRMFSEIETQ